MISDKAKILYVIAFALTVSGCGGGAAELIGEDVNTTSEIAGTTTDVTVATEVTGDTETSDGIATPVQPVGSVQMDAYVENPLLSNIPTELNNGTSTVTGAFITSPLVF